MVILLQENKDKEDGEAGLRDQLLPLVIGLLRTVIFSNLASVFVCALCLLEESVSLIFSEFYLFEKRRPYYFFKLSDLLLSLK